MLRSPSLFVATPNGHGHPQRVRSLILSLSINRTLVLRVISPCPMFRACLSHSMGSFERVVQLCMPNLPTAYAAWSAPPRTNLICWIRLELFITILAMSVRLIILVKLKDRSEKESLNTKEIPLLWVLTVKSPSTPSTRNISKSWTQTRYGTKEASRKPYIAARKPDLNKGLGRNPLPKAYKKLIKSCDLGSTSRSISRSCDSTHQTSTSNNQYQCWRSDLGWDTWVFFKGTDHDFCHVCWSGKPIYHFQKQGNIHIFQNK